VKTRVLGAAGRLKSHSGILTKNPRVNVGKGRSTGTGFWEAMKLRGTHTGKQNAKRGKKAKGSRVNTLDTKKGQGKKCKRAIEKKRNSGGRSNSPVRPRAAAESWSAPQKGPQKSPSTAA